MKFDIALVSVEIFDFILGIILNAYTSSSVQKPAKKNSPSD